MVVKMIYLDYSATTPTSREVLETFNKVSLDFIGNPNSSHKLGVEAMNLINEATDQIKELLKIKNSEIIYTSGSSEANNLAIKGICGRYRGKHIITTRLEHSSIYGPINNLQNLGYEVDFVDLDENGLVDLKHLESLITDDTVLVSIASVNSEVGIVQPIDQIGKLLKKYDHVYFHSDMTQSVGKINISMENVDLVSFTAHKFYGIKGIGCLIRKENVQLEPLINGGKSTSIYRSGTPCTALIASFSKALRLALENIDEKYDYITKLNNKIKQNLDNNILINSNQYSLPHILNVSVMGIKPETFQHALEKYDIYISTQSACSTNSAPSKAVMAVTNDSNRASSSVRISLSHLTSDDEVLKFIEVCNKSYNDLKLERR